MTKRQQSDTSGRPSRFCRMLLLVAGFKLCLLGGFLLEPLDFGGISLFGGESAARKQTVKNAASQASLVFADETPQSAAGGRADEGARTRPEKHAPGVAYAAQPDPAAQAESPRNQADKLAMDTLNRRQEELARKEQALKALESEINARLEEMQGLENRLQVMLKDAEEAKDAKFKHLVDVLSNMKARQAAEVLETLDEKIAVRVLAGMRGRQAGEILTYAKPAKAARLAESLARMQIPLE